MFCLGHVAPHGVSKRIIHDEASWNCSLGAPTRNKVFYNGCAGQTCKCEDDRAMLCDGLPKVAKSSSS